jgi:hypothetical protein
MNAFTFGSRLRVGSVTAWISTLTQAVPTGEVLARKHGAHAYDQWSVDELLARSAPRCAR